MYGLGLLQGLHSMTFVVSMELFRREIVGVVLRHVYGTRVKIYRLSALLVL